MITDSGIETKSDFGKYTYKDGNLVRTVTNNAGVITSTTEYDTKNNPFKNITGFNLLIGEIDTCINNAVKEQQVDSLAGSGSTTTSTYTYTYTYNADGFPTEMNESNDGVVGSTIKFTYL